MGKREETLNTHLGVLLDKHDGIQARSEEPVYAKVDGKIKKIGTPDVCVRQLDTPIHERDNTHLVIILEAKVGDTSKSKADAIRQLRKRLEKMPTALGYAVCYPKYLAHSNISESKVEEQLAAASLSFAAVPPHAAGQPVWRQGTVDDLAQVLHRADLPQRHVAERIAVAVAKTSAAIAQRPTWARAMAESLNLPRTKSKDLRKAAHIAALMLSNAMLIHHRLRRVDGIAEAVESLGGIRGSVNGSKTGWTRAEARTIRRRLAAAWDAILEIDYHPVFHPARLALGGLSDAEFPAAAGKALWELVGNAIAHADGLATFRFDHAGPLYHRLLATARFDGSFYTGNVAALFLSRLALPPKEGFDWSSADAIGSLRVIDPACGTGTLLMAAMHTMMLHHETGCPQASGDERELLQRELIESVLWGLDINRHGIQLAACNLTLGNPRIDYTRMNLYTMQHGVQADGTVRAGSLEMLETEDDREDETPDPDSAAQRWMQADTLFPTAPLPQVELVGGERAEPHRKEAGGQASGAAEPELPAERFDVMIMNPPFTRNDIRNRQYAKDDRRALVGREKAIAAFVAKRDPDAGAAIDQTSISTFFMPLAHRLLKQAPGATLAQILPVTALTGASGLRSRRFLADRFHIEMLVASHDPDRIAFSENTQIHEALLVARRRSASGQEDAKDTRIIRLTRMPDNAHEALHLADRIGRSQDLGEWGREDKWPHARMADGDWSAVQFLDHGLAKAMMSLEALNDTRLTQAENLCLIEPEGRRVRDAFLRPPVVGKSGYADKQKAYAKAGAKAQQAYPILWDHDTNRQQSMNGQPDDSRGVPRPEKLAYAEGVLWPKASRLVLVNRLRTNTIRASACYAAEPMLGSAWVPVRGEPSVISNVVEGEEEFHQAHSAWWNSSPGILTLLHARAKDLSYPRYALTSLRQLLIPDPRHKSVSLKPLTDAFRQCQQAPLAPWPEMADCNVRKELDAAAAEALGKPASVLAEWRRLIAKEPTVCQQVCDEPA